MSKFASFFISLFFVLAVKAQYRVTFILREKTFIRHDSIYLTGNFCNWDSTPNPRYLMSPHGGNEKSIVVELKAGVIMYKFHRGSWRTVEKQYNGEEVDDRRVTIHKDTTLVDSVESWRDQVITDKLQALVAKPDTTRIGILAAIASNYAFFPEYYNYDSALFYARSALELQQEVMSSNAYRSWAGNGHSVELINLQEMMATLLHSLGNYPKSLELRFENLKLAEKEKDKFIMAQVLATITTDYTSMRDFQNVLYYAKQSDSVLSLLKREDPNFYQAKWRVGSIIADAYYHLGQFDPALSFANRLVGIPRFANFKGLSAYEGMLLGDVYAAKGFQDSAFSHYWTVLSTAESMGNGELQTRAEIGLARLFQRENKIDSALYYARSALGFLQNNKQNIQAWGENADIFVADVSPLLAELYRQNHQLDSAYKYLHLSVMLRDSLYNSNKIKQFQTLTSNESARKQQLELQAREARKQYEAKIKIYTLVAGMAAIMILAFVLYRNNKHKQRANTLLQTQKQEIEKTLGELKNTQAQLIQSEKMASLGELTAGIAHEIQNPLNFVNNFAEVNKELLLEMSGEIDKGNLTEVRSIAKDVIDNEDKISHHGKRADAIVKGMLQHSRASNGVKEPTDVNALADEYLRLAYHGLRAKDKEFNATMETDYDPGIGRINIVPQDIGRVILNLVTNAFYAVREKASAGPAAGITSAEAFRPMVSVGTKMIGDKVFIIVADNGNGIPKNILDKIFQPFFTTRPSGQGTGLGLSLSYDIVKAHGGILTVESKEGEGSNFTISIPVTN